MKMSYLFFAAAVLAVIATAAYPGAETWTAAGVFAGVGVICLYVERRKPKPADDSYVSKYWQCPKCRLTNPVMVSVCTQCGTARGGALQP